MFLKAEFEHLRLRKDLLVLQCGTQRVLLAAEWQRVRSPELWWSEAGSSVRRHPMLMAVLGVGAGLLAVRFLRRPGAIIDLLGRLGGTSSTLWSVWKLFKGDCRPP